MLQQSGGNDVVAEPFSVRIIIISLFRLVFNFRRIVLTWELVSHKQTLSYVVHFLFTGTVDKKIKACLTWEE